MKTPTRRTARLTILGLLGVIALAASGCGPPAIGHLEGYNSSALVASNPTFSADGQNILVPVSGWVYEPGGRVFVVALINGEGFSTECSPQIPRPDVEQIIGVPLGAPVGFTCAISIPKRFFKGEGTGSDVPPAAASEVKYVAYVSCTSGCFRLISMQ